MGPHVTGVEPFPDYVASVTANAAHANVLDRINLYLAGAGRERGQINITYRHNSLLTSIITLDDLVKEGNIDMLSIDVHGGVNNYDVLIGGLNALRRHAFDMIWVEVFPDDSSWGRDVLDLLRKYGYILYDIKWSGGSKSCEKTGTPAELCKDLRVTELSLEARKSLTSAEAYMKALHREKNQFFQYLQTDIIVIHRTKMPECAPLIVCNRLQSAMT